MTAKTKEIRQLIFAGSLATLIYCGSEQHSFAQIQPAKNQSDEPKSGDSKIELTLWNDKPAANWLEAMPLGNGRLGAMVFGGVAEERLVLNEDTLYSGEPLGFNPPTDITKDFATVTNLIQTGQYAEADSYVTKHWTGRSTPCYQPLGNLRLKFDSSGEVSDYVRELDLKEAVAKVSYRQNGGGFQREVFASHPSDAIVIHLHAEKSGALKGSINQVSTEVGSGSSFGVSPACA